MIGKNCRQQAISENRVSDLHLDLGVQHIYGKKWLNFQMYVHDKIFQDEIGMQRSRLEIRTIF